MTLREQIFEFLSRHPRVTAHRSHTPRHQKLNRHMTKAGTAFAHEHNLRTVQHIWAPMTPRTVALGSRILSKAYPSHTVYAAKGPNGARYGRHSGLRAMPELAEADHIRFTPKDLDEVSAIIDALS